MMSAAREFCGKAVAYLKVPAPDAPNEVTLSQADSPVLRDLGNGLLVAYLVDEGTSFTYVQHRHMTEANVSHDELHKFGISNLEQLANERIQVREHGSVHAVLLDGNFEASLILVEPLWTTHLAHLVKHGFAAAIPARDVLAFCDAASTEGLAELRRIVSLLENGDHLLTPVLYRHIENGWSKYAA